MRIKKTYTYVDGYNVINAWPHLHQLMTELNLEAARDELIEILADYQKISGEIIYLIFDGHLVHQGQNLEEIQKDIHVIYTKEKETADSFIERQADLMNRYDQLKVISSDGMIQQLILGRGGLRVSSLEFLEDYRRLQSDLKRQHQKIKKNIHANLVQLDDKNQKVLEKLEHSIQKK